MDKKPTLFMNSLVYGLMTGVIVLIYATILNMTDTRDTMGWLGMVLMAGGMLLASITYRNKSLGGYITFGKAYLSGYYVCLVVCVMVSVYTFVYTTWIDPGMITAEMDKAIDQMTAKGDMSDEQIEKATEMMKVFMQPWFFAISAVMVYAIMGALIALITAAITKKDNPEPFQGTSSTTSPTPG
jgi:hypothetical protein